MNDNDEPGTPVVQTYFRPWAAGLPIVSVQIQAASFSLDPVGSGDGSIRMTWMEWTVGKGWRSGCRTVPRVAYGGLEYSAGRGWKFSEQPPGSVYQFNPPISRQPFGKCYR